MPRKKIEVVVTVDDLRAKRKTLNQKISKLRAEADELTAAIVAMESE